MDGGESGGALAPLAPPPPPSGMNAMYLLKAYSCCFDFHVVLHFIAEIVSLFSYKLCTVEPLIKKNLVRSYIAS